MFYDESQKPIYFGDQKVKGQGHNAAVSVFRRNVVLPLLLRT